MEKTKNIIVYEYLINKLVSSKLMLVCDLKKKNISLSKIYTDINYNDIIQNESNKKINDINYEYERYII